MTAFSILTVIAGIIALAVIGLALAAVAINKTRIYMNDNK